MNNFSKSGVYGARKTGEAFRGAEDRHVAPLEGGEWLHEIGRAFGKGHGSIWFLLTQRGGIVPAARRRSLRTLTLAEREDISRGIAWGPSIRCIDQLSPPRISCCAFCN
jgi:hypothetical protein